MILEARPGQAAAVAGEAKRLGGRVEARVGNLVQVRAPESIVRDLSSSESVSSARAPLLHVPAEVTGQEISSSGVERLHASDVDGSG